MYGLSLSLALSLLQGYFSGYSIFPPSTKTNIPKFQFNLETVDERVTLWKPLKFSFMDGYMDEGVNEQTNGWANK